MFSELKLDNLKNLQKEIIDVEKLHFKNPSFLYSEKLNIKINDNKLNELHE